ncbi:hypothetical protein SLEX105133_05550 [Slackia exigua]
MMKNELTTLVPGFVLMTRRAGERTSLVGWHAPLTSPWARPVLSSIVPKYVTSSISASACSIVMPFAFRISKSVSASSARSGSVVLSMTVAPLKSYPDDAMACGFPMMIRSASPSVRMRSAATSVRSSSPSGSTIVVFCFLAWEYTSLINVDMQDPFEAKIFVAKPKTFRLHALIRRFLQRCAVLRKHRMSCGRNIDGMRHLLTSRNCIERPEWQ